jgi:SAM-dependent methyltransferase
MTAELKPERLPPSEHRSPERLYAHYRIETELAARLLRAPREKRGELYASLYDELFRRVPDHPQLTRKARPRNIEMSLRPLRPFLHPEIDFLEVGPGDCALARAVAAMVGMVWAVDVSGVITKGAARADNFRVVISDGQSMPLDSQSVDVAYSNQLMEHLHPEDAREQLREIHRVLRPGGVYVCITPNRLSGPHDISGYFEDVARGFHLKEYTAGELLAMFREAGFGSMQIFEGEHGGHPVPLWRVRAIEWGLAISPPKLRRFFTARMADGIATSIRMVSVK